MQLKVPDGDRKTRAYHVVGVKPVRSERKTEASEHGISDKTQDKEAKKDPDKSLIHLTSRDPGQEGTRWGAAVHG